MILHLPFPPSVNHYWRHVGPRVLISRAGRQYREAVGLVCLSAGRPHMEGRLSVTVQVYPPDRRRRDLDNLFKAPLDAMKAAGVYDDDEQIDRLWISRQSVIPGGALSVSIEPIPEA
jgi:crossover junction endodeoxyribonuclease RusA